MNAITKTKSFQFEYEITGNDEGDTILIVEAHYEPASWEYSSPSINILSAFVKGKTNIEYLITPSLEDKLITKAWEELGI